MRGLPLKANIPLDMPEKVRRKATSMGEVGRAWLADLQQQVDEFERRWAIKVGQPMRHGTEAFVANARTRDGLDVVLKIVIPGIDPMRQELRMLQRANGSGYAKLICSDEVNNVMLLEKLGPQLYEFQYPEEMQLQVICATLHKAWMPASKGLPLTTGADKAIELSRIIDALWSTLGKPCSERTIEVAISYAERRRRAFDPARSVIAHGDAHQWNTLKAAGTILSFKFIDPDGVHAERAFDLAIPMREWGQVMPNGDPLRLGRQRCRLLSEFAGVGRQAIWGWALLQCVSNGLLLRQIGINDAAAVEFAMADAWAAGGDFLCS